MALRESPLRIGIPDSKFTVTRSRAPLRISFCGGGTDVPPYPERFGGCVLSCTIDKYAYVSLRPYLPDRVKVRSEDLGVDAEYTAGNEHHLSGKLDLAEAIFRRFGLTGAECFMESDAPPGSGLGSSSAMIVAMIRALARQEHVHLTAQETAELAVAVERHDLGIVGGLQDQFASSFGGFNFIEFTGSGVYVTPLRLSEDVLAELHYHLMLVYTGATRLSSNILAEQTASVESDDFVIMDALSKLKDLTHDLKRALLRNQIYEFGAILDEAWSLKRRLATKITNDSIEELYAHAKNAGAIGGKILGAGGGGYLLLCVPFDKNKRVRHAVEALGGQVVNFQFEHNGAKTWNARPDTWCTER